MPGGDRTGPRGMGPMTGRAAGYCAGFETPGFSNIASGRGFGGRGGFGGGRGWRHRYYATGLPGRMDIGRYPTPQQIPDPELEKRVLMTRAENLQSELDAIMSRLRKLETGIKDE